MAKPDKKLSVIKALERVAPGAPLREALDYIIDARTGALIVIGDVDHVERLCNGGFGVNCPFIPQKLFELAKMDGAIILDEDINRILRANVHLVPDSSLSTAETGMRHRTAERVAKQTNALVISISQKRDIVSLYVGERKYALDDIRVVLTKANQALQTLERYKIRLDQVSSNLSALEFEDLVTLVDVATFFQKSEMVRRVSNEIERYISELGAEGRLIQMQLEELMGGVEEINLMTLNDYCKDVRRVEKVKSDLVKLSDEDLLDLLLISNILGYKGDTNLLDKPVHPRGFRALKRIPRLPISVVAKIVGKFKDLQTILGASIGELDEVDGVGEIRARAIQEGLKRLREYNLMERYV